MSKKIRVMKVPECGYIVLGKGTYPKDQIVDVSDTSKFDPTEVKYLVGEKIIEEVEER